MNIIQNIEDGVIQGIKALYGQDITEDNITMNATRKEFKGDYTVVVFPFTRMARKKPEAIGQELGEYLKKEVDIVSDYNVIKGFLNLEVNNVYWNKFLRDVAKEEDYGQFEPNGQKVMVEFSSPNTNKPLHLGHIRNILLGWSTSKILEKAGYEVTKVQIINDRGIAICKSMLAWQKFGEGATPESKGIKSDHFVGKYYVLFEKKFKAEYKAWQETKVAQKIFQEKGKEGQSAEDFFKAYKNTYFNEYSVLGNEAKDMLLKWEANDEGVRQLWGLMNSWVYAGFQTTYKNLGVHFDQLYYESDTYLLGKNSIEEGLEKGIFYQKDDGSVWIDLTDEKLDHKLVLRSDGTSVYMTQDIGTAQLRYHDYKVDKMVYTVADEQNYHFKVLFKILKKLGEPYADGLHHLSYGMVDLPTGKMKSREGTVVDADDLMAEVIAESRANAQERGDIFELPKKEQEAIIKRIGLAALKYFIIKVNPQKRMTFDPKESVDMQGQTGPYVQNAYVRIKSVLRKGGKQDLSLAKNYTAFADIEKELLSKIYAYPELIQSAADNYDPSTIANFCYDLSKTFHKYYHDYSFLRAESEEAKAFRLTLATVISKVLKSAMEMLGIEMPEKM